MLDLHLWYCMSTVQYVPFIIKGTTLSMSEYKFFFDFRISGPTGRHINAWLKHQRTQNTYWLLMLGSSWSSLSLPSLKSKMPTTCTIFQLNIPIILYIDVPWVILHLDMLEALTLWETALFLKQSQFWRWSRYYLLFPTWLLL